MPEYPLIFVCAISINFNYDCPNLNHKVCHGIKGLKCQITKAKSCYFFNILLHIVSLLECWYKVNDW